MTPPATLRVLFREQDEQDETETTPGLACRFVADLVEILFVADHLATDRARRAELQERLWLQRDTMIKSKSQDWDIKRETDTFLKAVAWFSVRNVREIKPPLPLPRLRLLEDNRPLSSEYRRGYALLPAVHRVVSLAKRWLLGTHQGSVEPAHLASYLNEFVFRFNRRRSRSRGMVFYRVLELAVAHDPVRYQDLIATSRPRAVRLTPPYVRGHPPSLERPPTNRPWRTAALNWSG